MPIVIKELIIKTSLIEQPGGTSSTGGVSQNELEKLKRAIITECNQRLKKILDKKLQR